MGCGFDTPAPCHTARAADRFAHSAGPGIWPWAVDIEPLASCRRTKMREVGCKTVVKSGPYQPDLIFSPLQVDPSWAQLVSSWPKVAPSWHRIRSNWPIVAPSSHQLEPTSLHVGPKLASNCFKLAPSWPKLAQGRSKFGPSSAKLAPSWLKLGLN